MSTSPQYLTQKIVFDDGRRGVQHVTVYPDGRTVLTGVVVTRDRDGRRCRVVYDRVSSLRDHVFSLHDLAPATWSLARD